MEFEKIFNYFYILYLLYFTHLSIESFHRFYFILFFISIENCVKVEDKTDWLSIFICQIYEHKTKKKF